MDTLDPADLVTSSIPGAAEVYAELWFVALLVGGLARDPRLLNELARACSAGAAAWWQGRPMRCRIPPTTWSLETAPDERERCMFVGDGIRCERRTEWLIGSVAAQAYAYLCGAHLDFVRKLGQPAEPVVQPG